MAVILRQRRHPTHASDFNVLQDVMMFLWAIVKFKQDSIGLTSNLVITTRSPGLAETPYFSSSRVAIS